MIRRGTPSIHLHATGGIAASAPDEGLLYICCTDQEQDGYGFALTREPGEPLIEVMVADQTNCQTEDVTAELHRDQLVVRVPPSVAEYLEGHAEFFIQFEMTKEDFPNLDAVQTQIFSGVGRYERHF
jgi:hypothetical protein